MCRVKLGVIYVWKCSVIILCILAKSHIPEIDTTTKLTIIAIVEGDFRNMLAKH